MIPQLQTFLAQKSRCLLRTIFVFFLLCLQTSPSKASPDLSSDTVLRNHLWHDLLAEPKGQRPMVGLALSAGGTRAASHIGVISVLEEMGFPIDIVAGTSMGAIIGSFYAAGKTPEDLKKLILKVKVEDVSNFGMLSLLRYVFSQKLFSSKKLATLIQKEIGNQRFENLPKPFACVSMDINSGEAIIFREGRIAPAVRASMNLPGVFKPVQYRQRYLVDGAVVDYVPVDAARLLGAKWVLASVTEDDYTRAKPKNVLSTLQQVIDIRGAFISEEEKKFANFVIQPSVGNVPSVGGASVYMTPTPAIVDRGVLAATEQITKAKESYILFSMPSLAQNYLPSKKAQN